MEIAQIISIGIIFTLWFLGALLAAGITIWHYDGEVSEKEVISIAFFWPFVVILAMTSSLWRKDDEKTKLHR